VRSQQVPVKQQPKTPAALYPKTPLGRGRHDENNTAGLTAKGAVLGTSKIANQSGKQNTGRRPLATPMGRPF
jgi:hypothetical protein